MELSLDEKKALSQLSGYFKKLEITSEHNAIDLDDYISEFKNNGYARSVIEEQKNKSSKRKEVFQKASGKKEAYKPKTAKQKNH